MGISGNPEAPRIRPTGVAFTPDNYNFLKESGNITKTVNEIIEAHRLGASIAYNGKENDDCIQGLEGVKTCPFKLQGPELKKPTNVLHLLRCCNGCQAAKKDLAAFKATLKDITKVLQPKTPPQLKQSAFLKFTVQ